MHQWQRQERRWANQVGMFLMAIVLYMDGGWLTASTVHFIKRKNRNMKIIVVDGVHGSGKTTLVKTLRSNYERDGVSVYIVEEAARDCPYELCTVRGQRWIWYEHWQREIDARNSNADIVLCDRSVLGNLVYLRYVLDRSPVGYGEDAFKFFLPIAKLHMLKYDHVVCLPLNESYILNADDEYRSKDMVYARKIDEMFTNMVCGYVNTEVYDLFLC